MQKMAIMGVRVDKRTQSAPKVQEVLTKYGDSILSRVGIHDPGEEQHGLITLNVRDEGEKISSLAHDLEVLQGVSVSIMDMK